MDTMILASAVIDGVAVAAIAWLLGRDRRLRDAALVVQQATLDRLRGDLAALVADAERRGQELEAALGARERRLRAALADTARSAEEPPAPRLAIDPAEARLVRSLRGAEA